MKVRYLLLGSIAIIGFSSLGISSNWNYPAPPSLNKITVGSSYREVIKTFGKPSSVKNLPPLLERYPPSQQLHYPTLTIEVYKPEGAFPTHVASIVTRSSQWTVYPGIKVGMSKKEVMKLLGKPTEQDGDFLSWDGFPSNHIMMFSVQISNGRVAEIQIGEDAR